MTKLLLLLSLPLPALYVMAIAGDEGLPGLTTIFFPFIIIIVLVMLNGLFVASEFALIGVRPTQMEQMVNEGKHAANYILNILRSQDAQKHYIATAQVGISLASLGLGMYGEPQIAHFIEPYLARLLQVDAHDAMVITVGYLISVALLTYIHIVIGEMIPKSVALSAPNRAAVSITPFMRLMETIFTIPVRLLNALGAIILRLHRIPPAEGHARLHSAEELELIVEESAESGQLNDNEEEMISNIFDFSERHVHHMMTPRPKIQAISHDTPLSRLLKLVSESNYSRFPVYEADLDHIIGVLHLRDLVAHKMQQKGKFDIRLLLRPMPVIPEHYPAKKLLRAFKYRRMHIAIVLDEYGGTAGLVTLEDLVEEVVGEVRDEFDRESEPVVHLAPGVLEVAGDFLIEDLQEFVDLGYLNMHNLDTVGGLIMTKLGRLPKVGDKVIFRKNIQISVLAVDGRALARAKIEYPAPGEE